MKLLGTPKNEITKYKNEENVPNLENTEVVIVYCYIFNNGYHHVSGVVNTFIPNKSIGRLLDISYKILYFQKPLIQIIFKYSLLINILHF